MLRLLRASPPLRTVASLLRDVAAEAPHTLLLKTTARLTALAAFPSPLSTE